MVTRIDVHLQSEDISVYWLWILLYVNALSVVIVIIAICDMPRQEFSLYECVCIQNMYMKSRKSCSETWRKFRVKFPGGPVPNPSTIRRQAKRFKETGSVKNKKSQPSTSSSYRRNIRWDWREIRTYPQKYLKRLSQETRVPVSSLQRATKLLKLHIHIVNIHTFTQWEFLSRHVANRNNHNHYTYSTNI